MYVEKDHDPMHLLQNKLYDINQTEYIKKYSRGYCIDVGAFIGYTTLLMAKNATAVYAFEPNPYNFNLLNWNIQLNKNGNVWNYNYAVVDYSRPSEMDLYLCESNKGMSRLYPSMWCKDGTVKVKTIRLDDMDLDCVDFVKIDVEGSEFGVLLGMQNIIEKFHPILMMEFHIPSIEECGDNPFHIYDFLEKNNYNRIKLLANQSNEKDINDISYSELEKITSKKSSKNIICF